MTNSRSERLKLAMSSARNALGRNDTEGRAALSPLNRLRGVTSIEDSREGDLLSRTQVRQRPVYDSIAETILGPESEYKPAIELDSNNHQTISEIASLRLASLRERTTIEEIEEKSIGTSIGIMTNGKPIWSNVLDEQRGYVNNELKHFPIKSDFTPSWPPLLNLSSTNTWQNWHVVNENMKASIAAEKATDSPGGVVNPLLIIGEQGVGKSHLLSACSQAMIRRGDGNIHLINASSIAGIEKLPEGWQEAMAHATLVAIDDLHLVNGDLAAELGTMIDLALNHGVQIVCTSRIAAENLPSGRLWEVMRAAISVTIHPPSASSLMVHLRKSSAGRSLLLSDDMIGQIIANSDNDWRTVDSKFEKIALAVEAGEEILDSRDIARILAGEMVARSDADILLEIESLEDMASRVVTDVIDTVYTRSDIGGVDLHVPINEIEDDWEIPDITPSGNNEMLERLTDKALVPHVDHTLTVDERDEFLILNDDNLDSLDSVRVRETTASIDQITDKMFEDSTFEQINEIEKLSILEQEMTTLSEKSKYADGEELILIADRIQEIDLELQSLDEFTPSGEWEIDADEIEMDDLVESNPVLSRIKPVTVLAPLGEEE